MWNGVRVYERCHSPIWFEYFDGSKVKSDYFCNLEEGHEGNCSGIVLETGGRVTYP